MLLFLHLTKSKMLTIFNILSRETWLRGKNKTLLKEGTHVTHADPALLPLACRLADPRMRGCQWGVPLTVVSLHAPVQVQPGECHLLSLQQWSGRLSGADHWLVQRVDEKPSEQQVCPHPKLSFHSVHFFPMLTSLRLQILLPVLVFFFIHLVNIWDLGFVKGSSFYFNSCSLLHAFGPFFFPSLIPSLFFS